MLVLVTYDIADDRRLRRVAKVSEDFGRRVQKSVFECELDEGQVVKMKERLAKEMDLDLDSVRFYRVCGRCRTLVDVMGIGPLVHDDDAMIIV